ncbi:MAG TPA: glycosyltransferase family 2 protein [Vicinamibacterales bacterium]|nr:glycosyltransferase family 2 protein [Vicinamibacterales bacterium]
MSALKYSIVIATYNRAADLRETLASLAALRPDGAWEAIVVDNNSPDETRAVVEAAARTFPVDLRYIFEREQGRSPALNAGIRIARGAIIATTDDDVRVPADWLNRAAEGLERMKCDYVGGRVLPIWGAPRPEWIPNHGGKQWAVIALLDYGPEPMAFGSRVPLGVNMAFRREALDRAGLFDPNTGRRAGTLLGQEVREWCIRARKAGVHGFYIPELVLEHIIPADRLCKRYFRRWFFWRGISRARLYERAGLDMEAPEQTVFDFSKVPHVAGVPRYLYRRAVSHLFGWLLSAARGNRVAAFDHEVWVWFFAGILKQRWEDSRIRTFNKAMPAK